MLCRAQDDWQVPTHQGTYNQTFSTGGNREVRRWEAGAALWENERWRSALSPGQQTGSGGGCQVASVLPDPGCQPVQVNASKTPIPSPWGSESAWKQLQAGSRAPNLPSGELLGPWVAKWGSGRVRGVAPSAGCTREQSAEAKRVSSPGWLCYAWLACPIPSCPWGASSWRERAVVLSPWRNCTAAVATLFSSVGSCMDTKASYLGWAHSHLLLLPFFP